MITWEVRTVGWERFGDLVLTVSLIFYHKKVTVTNVRLQVVLDSDTIQY